MQLPPERIQSIAAEVADNFLKAAKRNRDDLDDLTAGKIAPLLGHAAAETLNVLAPQGDADEVFLDKYITHSYRIVIRSTSVTLTLLAATDRQMWFLRHEDGVVATAVAYPWDRVEVKTKTFSLSLKAEHRTDGCLLTGSKALGSWVERWRDPAARVAAVTEAAAATTASVSATGASPSPGAWHPDPSGRHELRWWDGTRWTEHVSDRGATSTDAI